MNKLWADDYGYSAGMSSAIEKLVLKDMLVGYSVMATHVQKDRDKLRTLKIGAHINFVEGGPVSVPSEVSTLVSRDGMFYPLALFVLRMILGLVDREDVERETMAQYTLLRDMGFRLGHVDTHQHTQLLPMVSDMIERLAKRDKLIVRNYAQISGLTWKGRLDVIVVKLFRFFTNGKKRVSRIYDKGYDSIYFLSWENDISKQILPSRMKARNMFVIHPGHKHDRWQDYQKLLE